jgi:hypothetical protein
MPLFTQVASQAIKAARAYPFSVHMDTSVQLETDKFPLPKKIKPATAPLTLIEKECRGILVMINKIVQRFVTHEFINAQLLIE